MLKQIQFCLFILVFLCGWVQAQEPAYDSTINYTTQIIGFPLANFDKNATGALLGLNSEENKVFFILSYSNKYSTSYKTIATFSADEMEVPFINSAKMYDAPTVTQNELNFCYEMPYKATEICLFFTLNQSQITFSHSTYNDPSSTAIEEAEKALAENNIAKAVEQYNAVMYPSNYLNEKEVGSSIMQKAHGLAMNAYKQKEYKNAARYMHEAFSYYMNTMHLEFASENEFKEAVEVENQTNKTAWNTTTFKRWVGDYGLFLYLSKDLQASEVINAYLTKILPDLTGPYLQLADTYYEMGNKQKASNVYKKYSALMKADNRQKAIPKRVSQRMK